MEGVNKEWRHFISLSEFEYGPLKTEKTQIHFLSNVLVAIASLDLKVPTIHKPLSLLILSQG